MIAIDCDVLTLFLLGDAAIVARMNSLPPAQLGVPVIVLEEMVRGRLNSIRQASAGRGKVSLELAYWRFQELLHSMCQYQTLSYSAAADALYQAWRQQRVRIGTSDLRIAAICVSLGARLVTRNARDYGLVPGLIFEVW